MTESQEIDNLKRKIEDAKMKLVTEIKVTDFLAIYQITKELLIFNISAFNITTFSTIDSNSHNPTLLTSCFD